LGKQRVEINAGFLLSQFPIAKFLKCVCKGGGRLPSLPVQRLPAAGWLENWRQDAAITGNQDGCRHRFRPHPSPNSEVGNNARPGRNRMRPHIQRLRMTLTWRLETFLCFRIFRAGAPPAKQPPAFAAGAGAGVPKSALFDGFGSKPAKFAAFATG
jgi:hypothetical protein